MSPDHLLLPSSSTSAPAQTPAHPEVQIGQDCDNDVFYLLGGICLSTCIVAKRGRGSGNRLAEKDLWKGK